MRKIILLIFLLFFLNILLPNKLFAQSCGALNQPCCATHAGGSLFCNEGNPSDTQDPSKCICLTPPPSQPIQPKFCTKQYTGATTYTYEDKNCIETAIGDIPTDPQELVNKLLPWIIGLAGGIAFVLMLFGAFQVLTSAADPEKLKKGKETLTSAIIGLLLIIFSVFILRIFGLPIMKISM